MTEYRLTDAQLTAALRAHLPSQAPAGLDERIRDEVIRTRQVRPWPMLRVDPAVGRSRWLLVAAALIVLLAALAAIGIGRQLLQPPTPEQLLERAWGAMAQPPAFTMDLETTAGREYRVLAAGGTGGVRFETVETDDPAFDDWYFLAESDRIGLGDRSLQLWDEDPRVGGPPLAEVWFPAAMADWRASSDPATWPPDPACDWEGPEPLTVAGRDAQRLTCGPLELGLDVATGLPLVASWIDDEGRSTRLAATTFTLGDAPEEAFDFGPTGPEIMVLTDPQATAIPDIPPVDAFELERAAGAAVAELPAFMAVIRDSQGTQVRWYHDGQGTVRMEHFGRRSEAEPSESWLGREGRMLRREHDGTGPVFVEYTDQGDPRMEFAMGLGQQCEGPWTYHGLEVVADRPAHHITACAAQFWIDVETLFVLRAENHYQMSEPAPAGIPRLTMRTVTEAIEFVVGPQPAELFDFERQAGGEPVVSAAEFQCRIAPDECAPVDQPRVEVARLPQPLDAAAPDGATTDPDAVVAAALATHADLPALRMVIRRQSLTDQRDDSEWEDTVHADGAGHEYTAFDWDLASPDNQPTIYLDIAEGDFESYDDGQGGVTWRKWEAPPPTGPDYQRSFGIERACVPGWEHLGFATMLDGPVHHLRCEQFDFWVDVASGMVLRVERGPVPQDDGIWIEEIVALEMGPQPPELFVLPEGDAVSTGRP